MADAQGRRGGKLDLDLVEAEFDADQLFGAIHAGVDHVTAGGVEDQRVIVGLTARIAVARKVGALASMKALIVLRFCAGCAGCRRCRSFRPEQVAGVFVGLQEFELSGMMAVAFGDRLKHRFYQSGWSDPDGEAISMPINLSIQNGSGDGKPSPIDYLKGRRDQRVASVRSPRGWYDASRPLTMYTTYSMFLAWSPMRSTDLATNISSMWTARSCADLPSCR